MELLALKNKFFFTTQEELVIRLTNTEIIIEVLFYDRLNRLYKESYKINTYQYSHINTTELANSYLEKVFHTMKVKMEAYLDKVHSRLE
jgi:hypothetical protein